MCYPASQRSTAKTARTAALRARRTVARVPNRLPITPRYFLSFTSVNSASTTLPSSSLLRAASPLRRRRCARCPAAPAGLRLLPRRTSSRPASATPAPAPAPWRRSSALSSAFSTLLGVLQRGLDLSFSPASSLSPYSAERLLHRVHQRVEPGCARRPARAASCLPRRAPRRPSPCAGSRPRSGPSSP